MLRKRASAKIKLQAEAETKPNVGLAVKYPAEKKAGKGDRKRLEKGETSSAEVSDELSEDFTPEDDLMDGESSNQVESKAKYQIQFGSLPEKVDCQMVEKKSVDTRVKVEAVCQRLSRPLLHEGPERSSHYYVSHDERGDREQRSNGGSPGL